MDLNTGIQRKYPRQKAGQARPKIKPDVRMRLWLRSGGICSFRGCEAKLDEHAVTFQESNFSNIAHIIAFKKDGPRGAHSLPVDQRNDYDNLMLVCTECHHLIDSKEHEHSYPADLLKLFKIEHEQNIEFAKEILTAGQKTQLLRCRANILSEVSQISFEQMTQATLPRFPRSRRFIDIDMTRAPGTDSSEYWASKKQEITDAITRALLPGGADFEIDHLSIFALGPMPLLIHLGNRLSNKVTTDLFQRHRDSENWMWKSSDDEIGFQFEKIRDGSCKDIILLLNLSGRNSVATLPEELESNKPVYEVTLRDRTATPTFLNSKNTLEQFKLFYRGLIDQIKIQHREISKIHLFPAVPAPIAVLCGRELLHKADPVLVVYDYNKNKNGFEFAMEVNDGR